MNLRHNEGARSFMPWQVVSLVLSRLSKTDIRVTADDRMAHDGPRQEDDSNV
jgi:hypothetical protein